MSGFRKLSNLIDIEQFQPPVQNRVDIQPVFPFVKPIPPVIDPLLWREAIKRSNIQKLYHDASIDNCPKLPPGIVDLGKRWIKSQKKPSLYIFGNTGSGKTHFSTALYRAMVEQKHPWIIFVRSDDLDDELLTAIEERQEKNRMMKYFEVPLLFIDDMGVERPSDRIIRQYYSIIDKRVGSELTTIITSNVPLQKLPLGDRTISRLGHFYAIEFPKIDIRKDLDLPDL